MIREENLHTKIKGKILLSKHYSKNLVNGRSDRVMCAYEEYSTNIPENRLIKRALLFAQRTISIFPAMQKHQIYTEISYLLSKALSAFEGVQADVDISSVRKVRMNKLFGEYGVVVNLAKQLLKDMIIPLITLGMRKIGCLRFGLIWLVYMRYMFIVYFIMPIQGRSNFRLEDIMGQQSIF